MKYLLSLAIAGLLLTLSGCNSEPEERTELSDYKNQQLDKAKAVEEEMQKRIDNIDKQLEESTGDKDDDTL